MPGPSRFYYRQLFRQMVQQRSSTDARSRYAARREMNSELPAACDELAAITFDTTVRRAATRAVMVQKSANAIVGGRESGRRRAEQ